MEAIKIGPLCAAGWMALKGPRGLGTSLWRAQETANRAVPLPFLHFIGALPRPFRHLV